MRYRAWMIEHPMGDPLGGPPAGRYEDMGGLIGGAVSVVGGLLGSDSAGDAAQTQADAANRAADLTWKQFQQTRDDLAPYREPDRASFRS